MTFAEMVMLAFAENEKEISKVMGKPITAIEFTTEEKEIIKTALNLLKPLFEEVGCVYIPVENTEYRKYNNKNLYHYICLLEKLLNDRKIKISYEE